ncbi:MAG: Holliday junction resolvase RuvX [bacterium]|nr:Holliday junction resolvase RuvX [bacterium]
MRYLGLDVGSRHIGVAVGELLASELTTLDAPKNQNYYDSPQLADDEIVKLIASEQVDAIVVGLPVNEQGELSAEAESIKKFADQLGVRLDKTIHFVNETLSSFMAEDILESQGLSIQEAKLREHQLSAQLILQQYIEENVRA